jgi:hypothetical protein
MSGPPLCITKIAGEPKFGDHLSVYKWEEDSQSGRPGRIMETLIRSLKYEEVYLKAYADGREARAGIGAYLD